MSKGSTLAIGWKMEKFGQRFANLLQILLCCMYFVLRNSYFMKSSGKDSKLHFHPYSAHRQSYFVNHKSQK